MSTAAVKRKKMRYMYSQFRLVLLPLLAVAFALLIRLIVFRCVLPFWGVLPGGSILSVIFTEFQYS
eukprot:COSAG02_NODE_1026_length_15134_cov_382.979714_2_plen_66_part_00